MTISAIQENILKLSASSPSLKIDSVFLEQNGKVETLFYQEENLHELRSASKVLVAMAVGIALDRGMFSLDTLIYPFMKDIVNIENKANEEKIKKWTIRNLLTHTTGYESQMLSEQFIKDIDKDKLLEYAFNYDIPYGVGERFAYNNVEPFLLSIFFQETFHKNLSDFINETIFQSLDIKKYQWNNYGKYCPGATGLYLKHSDFHKIGKLLLYEGKYNGIQVVPKYWIAEMCTLQLETPSVYKKERVFPKIGIGYYTFISRDGYIFRDGANGQYMIMNKEKNLLITILSSENDMKNIPEIFRNLI